MARTAEVGNKMAQADKKGEGIRLVVSRTWFWVPSESGLYYLCSTDLRGYTV